MNSGEAEPSPREAEKPAVTPAVFMDGNAAIPRYLSSNKTSVYLVCLHLCKLAYKLAI